VLPKHISALKGSSSGSTNFTFSQPDQQIALCYTNMFRPSKGHLQGVRILYFHNQINKMCIHFVDLAMKMYNSYSLNTKQVGVTQR